MSAENISINTASREISNSYNRIKMVWIIISLLSIGSIANQVQCYRYQQEAEENQELHIFCGEYNGIRIISAKWTYNRLKARNWITPNMRMFSFFWGKYLGIGTWDVTKTVEGICGLEHKCKFKATRELFGDCGYQMFLAVNYVCIECTDRKRKKRSDTEANRCYEWQEGPFVDNNNNTFCPNKRFEFKHVDTNRPISLESAELAAIHFDYRRINLLKTSPAKLISVFLTGRDLINYVEENSTICAFTQIFPKYNCEKIDTRQWNCTYKGDFIARHDKLSGHYLNESDSVN